MITITKPVEPPARDRYVFEIVAMHGDADNWTDVVYIADDLEDAERVVAELAHAAEHRREIEWYNKVFKVETGDEEDDFDMFGFWPCDDPEYNSNRAASLWSWALYYYDENGVKYHTDKKGGR